MIETAPEIGHVDFDNWIDKLATRINNHLWIDVSTFENSWVNYGAGYNDAGYYKDILNRVHLRGLVKDGTIGAYTIFSLPTGYRPESTEIFSAASANAFGRVDVLSTGEVRAIVGANAHVSLDGISFTAV